MILKLSKCYVLLVFLLTLFCFDLVAGSNDFLLKGRTTPIRNSAFTRTLSRPAGFFTASRDIRYSSRRFCSESLKKESSPPQKHGLFVKGVTFAIGFVGGGATAYWWAQKNHYTAPSKKY